MNLRIGSWQELAAPATQIRFAVFVDEQGIARDEELDELDAVCVHAVVECEGLAAATGRLCPDGRIGRMAVLKSHRGRRLGSMVIDGLINEARRKDMRKVYLHAQCHALGFYARFGFSAHGPIFKEAGIDHREMRRSLAKAAPKPGHRLPLGDRAPTA